MILLALDRPLISRPKDAKYRTLLSIDGGGVRGIIPVMVLIELEKSIKEHIIENRDTLVPADIRDSIHSVDDFDVNLVDYFDLVAGTSVGSWIACYIAARGRGTETFLKDPEVVADYGNLRPGCMAAGRAVTQVLGPRVFKSNSFLPQVITSLFRPAFSSDGLKAALTTMFGETTMDDLETDCIIMTYDLKRNAACSFLRDNRAEEKNCLIRTDVRQQPRSSSPVDTEKDDWTPDLIFVKGQNYRLRDIALGSSSLPLGFPPARITPINVQDPEELVLIDGGVVARNPTLQALTYIPSSFSSGKNSSGENSPGDIRNVGVFSVGCGVVDLTNELNYNPGMIWWMQSRRLLDAYGNGGSEYIQAAMDYWLYGNIGLPFGQYVRIQTFAPGNTKTGQILSQWNNPNNGEALEDIGRELAQKNRSEIKRFVSDFVFAPKS